jgi:hypothetical protein
MTSGVSGGTEEIWNVKELAKRIGTTLGRSHPTPLLLSFVMSRVGPMTDPVARKVGAVDGWIEQFHGATFTLARDTEKDEVLLGLTEDGVARFASSPTAAAATETLADKECRSALSAELRDNVFGELRQEADRRRAAGELYKAPADPTGAGV